MAKRAPISGENVRMRRHHLRHGGKRPLCSAEPSEINRGICANYLVGKLISSCPLLENSSMAETVSKTCPICYSAVDARAKKCSHCHSLLGIYKVVVPALVV